jgi:hypothetical protein
MTTLRVCPILVVPGLVPALALRIGLARSLLVAPVATGLMTSAAGMAALVTRTTLIPWFVLAALAANLLATRHLYHAERRPLSGLSLPESIVLAIAAGVAAAPMLATSIGFDARAYWFNHARWFYGGGDVVARELVSAVHGAQSEYPPYASSAIALVWKVTGEIDDRPAQLTVSVLTGCAVVLLASALVVACERGSVQRWVAVAVGGLLILAAYDFAASNATNGFVDLLCAALGASAAALALRDKNVDTLPLTMMLVVATSLVKTEGLILALGLSILIVIRYGRGVTATTGLPHFAPLLAILVWPAIVRASAIPHRAWTPHDFAQFVAGDARKWDRFGPVAREFLDVLSPWFGVAAFVVIVTIVLLHAATRLGWLLGLVALQTLALGLTYVIIAYGDGAPASQVQSVRIQLATSWDRVSVFPRIVAALVIADCALMLVRFLQRTGEVTPSADIETATR